jgi:hypothetical protein
VSLHAVVGIVYYSQKALIAYSSQNLEGMAGLASIDQEGRTRKVGSYYYLSQFVLI